MGMSASQARLIALTARMSDTEYEAQQINQQRLTLSNKMNEVYEALVNMDVPTPPSKADYAKTVYTGKLGSNAVKVKPNASGKLVAYSPVSGQVVDRTMGTKGGTSQVLLGSDVKTTVAAVKGDDQHYGLVSNPNDAEFFIDVDIDMAAACKKINPSDYQIASPEECDEEDDGAEKFIDLGNLTIDGNSVFRYDDIFDENGEMKEGLPEEYYDAAENFTEAVDAGSFKYLKTSWSDVPSGTSAFTPGETYRLKGSADVIKGEALMEEQARVASNRAYAYKMDENGEFVKLSESEIDSAIAKGEKIFVGISKAEYNALSATDKSKWEGVADNNTSTEARGLDSIDGLFVVEDDNSCRPLTAEDCEIRDGKFYLIDTSLRIKSQSASGVAYKDSTQTVVNDGTVTNSSGMTGSVISFAEAKAKYENDENFKLALQGLQHTCPDAFDANGDMKTEDGQPLYDVVAYPNGTFAFVMTSDYEDSDGNVFIYEPTKGSYDAEMEEGTYTINYDVNGVPCSLKTTDGANIILETTTEYDEYNFAKDTAAYTAEKVEYDREQNRLNKQTSIYQRQDKQLELKLTRLDSERNALNTEIEAVKKVIQDSIDKGFKTFSG